jgi:hypothetical protein
MGRRTEGVAVPCATAAYEFVKITAKNKGEVTVGMLMNEKKSVTGSLLHSAARTVDGRQLKLYVQNQNMQCAKLT